jgi:hypothetical protein
MTRAHARLLGPCFKTGPESTQSYSAVDWLKRGLSEDHVANSRSGPDPAPGPDFGFTARACDGPDANNRGPAPFFTVGRAGRDTAGPDVRSHARRGYLAGLRPAPNGSRRPTGGEVHASDTGRLRTARFDVVTSTVARKSLARGRDALESPLSTFRVSQVYP